jgi:hypothetical protein
MWPSSTLRRTHPSMQVPVTLVLRDSRSNTKVRARIVLWPKWQWAQMLFCTVLVHCLLFPSAVSETRRHTFAVCRSGMSIGLINRNQCASHTSSHGGRASGLLLKRWTAFERLRRTTNFAKIICVLILSRLLDYYMLWISSFS